MHSFCKNWCFFCKTMCFSMDFKAVLCRICIFVGIKINILTMKKYLLFGLLCCGFQATMAQSALQGTWTGKLKTTAFELTVVLHATPTEGKSLEFTLDSPDQNVKGIPMTTDYLSADSLALSINQMDIHLQGHYEADEISGTFLQNHFIFPLKMTRHEEKISRPQTPQPPFPYTQQEVVFENKKAGASLAGTLTYPVNFKKGKTSVVLMVTGSGQQNRDEEVFEHRPFAVIADYFARHGIATLRYDDRNFGQSKGGDVAHATTQDFAQDAEAGIDYLRKRHEFGKIGVLGHSEGGNIAFILGAQQQVDFIISMAAVGVKGDEALTEQVNKCMEIAGEKTRMTVAEYRKLNVGEHAPWLDYFLDYDPTRDLRHTTCPVFALNGDKDCQVIATQNLTAIREKLPINKASQTKIYQLNHLFQHCQSGLPAEYRQTAETIAPEVLTDMAKWINDLAK